MTSDSGVTVQTKVIIVETMSFTMKFQLNFVVKQLYFPRTETANFVLQLVVSQKDSRCFVINVVQKSLYFRITLILKRQIFS